jgi:hypothetical protein
MKTAILTTLSVAALMTGCSTNNTNMADRDRQSGQSVVVFSQKPENAQVISAITTNSYAGLTLNQAYKDALRKLQYQARQMGANGLIIDSTNDAALMGARINAEAIYVPAPDNADGLISDDDYWYFKK